MTAILTKEPPGLSEISRAVPPWLERIVRRCLEKRPEERFQSAHDLALALEVVYQFRHILLPWTGNPPEEFPWPSDPRFIELRRRMNFPPVPTAG